jgi:adenylylsulfate kinase
VRARLVYGLPVAADPQRKSPNVVWQNGLVLRGDRETQRGHRGAALWFTGLSGSGKSTLAGSLERALYLRGVASYGLDGDNVRHGLCSDLGFSPEDRSENVRRIGEVAKLFVDAGIIVLCAFVSPYRADRDRIRANMEPGDFVELYVQASLEACQRRDPKGLYRQAADGQITNMTGLGAPYEPPLNPELTLDTESLSTEVNVSAMLAFLERHGYIAPVPTPIGR